MLFRSRGEAFYKLLPIFVSQVPAAESGLQIPAGRIKMYKKRTWFFMRDGKRVEVTQKHVYEALVNTYKNLTSIEDLVSENLGAAEEGY